MSKSNRTWISFNIFFYCLSIWKRMSEYIPFLTLGIKKLIALSSGNEKFRHWYLLWCFSLPIKSAVHQKKKITCHITWFYAQQSLKLVAFFSGVTYSCHASCNFGTFFLQYFNGQTWVIYFPISNPSALTVQNSWGYELMQKVPAELSIFSSGLSVSSPQALEK